VAITRNKGISVFAILGVAGLILTGCSSSDDSASSDSGASSSASSSPKPMETPVEEQTVIEACNELIAGVSEMQSSLTENLSELQTDPAAAAAAFEEVVALFQENAANVTNAEVKPTADKIEALFVEFSATMQAAATDPASVDPQAVTTYATDLQAATTELDEICGAA
jgi:hypothetical protein